jgi:ATP-dependent Clp protease ATP-binding subunit ClpC
LGYQIKLSDAAKGFIAEKGFDPQYGARPLKRAIQKYVEDVLAEQIILSQMTQGDAVVLDWNEGNEALSVGIEKGTTAS